MSIVAGCRSAAERWGSLIQDIAEVPEAASTAGIGAGTATGRAVPPSGLTAGAPSTRGLRTKLSVAGRTACAGAAAGGVSMAAGCKSTAKKRGFLVQDIVELSEATP
ncbi:hypothetical protein Aglo03_01510 [Actinokineospora globicatena]|uniref:Uncharacterized protein n=1 Tax=Actinokineospora globicatena TaxID=103729 RepID=A0A9W6QIJ4_9PSEU|nr:hypothetical protein Aglo03_01510 [Actinokineospora globicatena]